MASKGLKNKAEYLENIVLSEKKTVTKDHISKMSPPQYEMSRMCKSIETESRFVVARSWGAGEVAIGR